MEGKEDNQPKQRTSFLINEPLYDELKAQLKNEAVSENGRLISLSELRKAIGLPRDFSVIEKDELAEKAEEEEIEARKQQTNENTSPQKQKMTKEKEKLNLGNHGKRLVTLLNLMGVTKDLLNTIRSFLEAIGFHYRTAFFFRFKYCLILILLTIMF